MMKLVLLVFVVVAVSSFTSRAVPFPQGWLERWNQWDAPHYIDIARDGYVTTDLHTKHQKLWIVFYPLFPWTVRAVAMVVRDFVLAAHIVSLVAAIIAAVVFQRLVELDFDAAIARSAVVFMFIFPTAYFFHAGYTESLFMALALDCVLAARHRRWGMAALTGALASLTRVNGLLLVPVLMTEAYLQYREEKRFQRGWLLIPLAGAGFLVYLLVNKMVWNDAFYFQKVLRYSWSKTLAPPWTGVARAFTLAAEGSQLRGTQELVFVAVALVCTVWCWIRLRPSYAVWMTLNLLLITSTSTIVSTPRYALILFPMFILFALLAAERPLWGRLITLWSLMFLALFSALFGAGSWAF